MELTQIVEDATPAILLYDEASHCPLVLDKMFSLHVSQHEKDLQSCTQNVDVDDPWLMIYTGGTTGRPKGVVLSFKKFWKKAGGHLSGGQKQMLSMARAFINDSQLILIDEPSKGLAPIVVEKVMEAIVEMKKKTSIVLVEQNFIMASRIGDTYTLIDDGRTVNSGSMQDLI